MSEESWAGSKEQKENPEVLIRVIKGKKDRKIERLKGVHKWAINVTYQLFQILKQGFW